MKLQADEGSDEFVQVELDGETCSCGCPRCVHLDIAADVVRDHGRRWRWLVRSAFHKELRRGDVLAAQHWAAWLAHCDGPSAPMEYMRKIWSEETVDLDLAVYLHAATATNVGGVERFCAAVKVWQVPAWWSAFQEWSEVHARVAQHSFGAAADRFLTDVVVAQEAEQAVLRDNALADLTGASRLTTDQANVFRARYASRRFENEDFLLAMLLADRLPMAKAADKAPHPDISVGSEWTDGSTLLLPPPYAYDYHSYFGKSRMRAWMDQHPGCGFRFGVDTAPVDLRWAGGLVPLFWRVQAWQHGGRPAMDELRWHQLEVEPVALRRFEAWCDWWPEDAMG